MSNGFIQIPRSLLEHPTILALSDSQYRAFIHLLMKMCYAPCQQDDHGVLINLEPGDIMFTLRKLASELGVSKSSLERLITRLTHAQISRHETRHIKTILTFTHPELCELLKKQSGTSFETKSRQDRDKIETEKNNIISKEDKEASGPRAPEPSEKTVSILEGWEFERDLRPTCILISKENFNIHYQTANITKENLSDADFVAFVIACSADAGFTDQQLIDLRAKKISIERVFLGLCKLTGRRDVKSPFGLLAKICQEDDFKDLKQSKPKFYHDTPRPEFDINPKRVVQF